MMFDCWKNSCQGATVVPTIAMISSTAVELAPPRIPGEKVCWTMFAMLGCAKITSGTTRKLATTNTYMNRSQLRKLPVAVIAINATAAIGTATYLLIPK
jgi:hypothetical protein